MFEKGDKPSLLISTLEALAILAALTLHNCDDSEEHTTREMIVPSWTDNRGNGAALNKLRTTKFLASAVLMELLAFMNARGPRTVVEWTPSECNREADTLANGQLELLKKRSHQIP